MRSCKPLFLKKQKVKSEHLDSVEEKWAKREKQISKYFAPPIIPPRLANKKKGKSVLRNAQLMMDPTEYIVKDGTNEQQAVRQCSSYINTERPVS